MAQFKPRTPFNVAFRLLTPTYKTVQGVPTKTFPDPSTGALFYGSFKTYGGTERDVNGLYEIIDTANVETWYRPDIKSDSGVVVVATGAVYEVLNEPENVDMRNQYLAFKVRRVKGGA